ncbi:non-hydrolyzing UDP-N-acetylglucosamine 2-epimerase [Dictyoglomus thermophilum]|uniref:UDP-N-acetylglucosamine 2-epimerase (non-hydrolyzing) n=2 Tax=Dictyoglomus thermophilum TaxID=14 RepID=B5YF19_DICT6|nr:UDP-N-acetylglucosamine 2-epimerase (non-hydrolyzing) [Dictyoglomus thermophilum]ACI19231.1 UDP-N-acetylglucosamine 2-epimerase [Dictyoglomus thermophilum H-6-12]MCX7719955.1 UDP-N-acetylglucosamine 2-epimerase (non-hydrolyzing) [Dictyoglomus thermophilum]TYT22598.1 UDP-N-acetylglucosamine 2-epimerase (non-hydrolyzing) [Dictyoglomus thermophilum]
MKKKISLVFGTRPEAIKMAPVAKIIKESEFFDLQIILTAQHRELLDQVIEIFGLKSDYDLNIMQEKQTLTHITVKVLQGLDIIWQKDPPDMVLVHGDTTTTFAASLAAFYKKLPIGHVEAGLRTYNKYQPYPEEMNRHLTGVLADLHFAPTQRAKDNLINERVPKENIFITGNTVIDALLFVHRNMNQLKPQDLVKNLPEKFILVTAHRRENWGEPLKNIVLALDEILKEFEDFYVVFPVHPNPLVREQVYSVLKDNKRAILIPPVDYVTMVYLLDKCYLVLTDSGGLQEEAPSLGKPVLVLREVTERPEAVEAGTVKIVGTSKESIVREVRRLILNKEEYVKMSKAINPYGDGKASERIRDILLYYFGFIDTPPSEFNP